MPITITVLDTGGIQPFIFGSNALRENIGASELVHRATRLWAFEALLDEWKERGLTAKQTNINFEAAKKDDVEHMYSGPFRVDGTDKIGAEVLYAGGGNTVILFQGENSDTLAKDFVYRLSKRLLSDAPGLNLYAAHKPYTWKNTEKKQSLPEIVEETIKELGALKGTAAQSKPALGFPVTATCTSTGLPANGTHPDTKGKIGSASRANRQVMSKWPTADLATARLEGTFERVKEARFEWAHDFEWLARLEHKDDSYIAVVHADGNGMGQRIKDLVGFHKQHPDQPRAYIEAMRGFSNALQDTAQKALRNTLNALVDHLAVGDWEEPRQHAVRKGENGQPDVHYFPVRPLVFGGDDMTLVCAGPWGLAIAQRYLVELEKQTMPDGQGGELHPYACAGVAIVKTHYPFSQAYDLSEELMKSAKARTKRDAKKQASALDWHFTTTGLAGKLREIRDREYTVHLEKTTDRTYTEHDSSLHFRPVMLLPKYGWRKWDTLTRLMRSFGEDGDWQVRRNKTVRLREALRGGPDRVAEFWAIFREEGLALPTIPLPDNATLNNGWVEEIIKEEPKEKTEEPKEKRERRSLYFDAIEVAEQFFELPDKKEGSA